MCHENYEVLGYISDKYGKLARLQKVSLGHILETTYIVLTGKDQAKNFLYLQLCEFLMMRQSIKLIY